MAAGGRASPAAGVPVAVEVVAGAGHYDLVSLADPDLEIAPRASVHLRRLVRVHVPDLERIGVTSRVARPRIWRPVVIRHRQPPKNAHATSAATTTNAATTSTMSLRRCTCSRNGLNPMAPR